MELQPKTKTPSLRYIRGLNGIYINQLGKESNSLKIGSQAGRVNTHHEMKRIEIDTNTSNFIFIVNHSNWGKNWRMKRKTSVMRVTKLLR